MDKEIQGCYRASRIVVGAGLAWAGLCLALFAGGHAPSRVLLPVPPGLWYAVQAGTVVPALVVGWLVASGVADRLLPARLGLARTASALALPFGGGLLAGLIVPESLAYAVGGFEALRRVAPFAGLALVVLATGGGAARLRARAPGPPSWPRALGATFVGLLVQAVLLSPVLR